MDSLVTVLKKLEDSGFISQFEIDETGLKSMQSDKTFQPHEIRIVRTYRFEGDSNPDDSAILYALETIDNEKGTLVDGYGVSADTATGAFMKKVTVRP